MNLDRAQETWRQEGWIPPGAGSPRPTQGQAAERDRERVRSYRVESTAAGQVGGPEGATDPAMAERTEEGVIASDATVRQENEALERSAMDDDDLRRDANRRGS